MLRSLKQQVLRPVFRVQEGEGLRAAVMLLYSIAAVGGVIITGQLTSRALFLSNLPRSAIPFKFILPPLALMAVTAVYARLARRFRIERLVVGSHLLILLGVILFRLLMATPYRQEFAALCALFVFIDVVCSLVILQFWTFAGEIFNAREAKRLFGLIAGGSTVSNVLFGGVLSSIARAMAPENLLFVVMASLLVCIFCVWFLGRRYGALLAEAGAEGEEPSERGSIVEDLRQVLRSPLVASMSGILVVVALVSSIADYQLDLSLQARYAGDSQGMVGFLGQFRLWAGLGAGVMQFFLAGRLLERFGVAAALLLLPSGMILGSGAILLTGGMLWATAVPRACDVVLKYTINDASFNLLYLPVEAQLRARARAVLDGMIKPPMVALLGVLFMLAGQGGSASILHWSYVVLALAAFWIVLVVRVGRQYVAALSQSIRFRRLDPDREQIDLAEESSVRVIRETLQAPDAMRVVHALSLLPRIPRVDWTPHVAVLLDHADARVRVLALENLAAQEAAIYAEEVHARLRDPEEQVRAAAVAALCALGKLRVIPQMLPFLEDASSRVRGAAVLGLIEHTGLDGILHAGETLKALLADDDPQARLEGVRVLEALRVPSFYHPLVSLLDDDSVEVQIGTIRAAGRIGAPELVPHLIPKLNHPLTRWYATEALARCVARDLSLIGELLDDERRDIEVRRQLIHVLRQEGSEQAIDMLCGQLQADDDLQRGAVYESLLELRSDGTRFDRRRLRAALRRELHRAYQLHVVHRDLRQVHTLLAEALEIRIRQAQDRILSLLDLLYVEISLSLMRESLVHQSSRMRAAALELIDNVVDRDLHALLMPLFSGSGGEQLSAACRQLRIVDCPPTERLRTLATEGDTWLRCCALHAIGERQLAELGAVALDAVVLDAVAREAGSADEKLVQETALVACGKLYGWEALRQRFADQTAGGMLPERVLARDPAGVYIMALSPLEKVFFLKSAALFEHIPGEDIVGMVPIIHEVEIKKGETFIKEGEEGDCLYILVDGEVVACREGKEYVNRSGEVIGERAVLTERPRSGDCTALTDVVALRIDKKDFWKLMEEQPKITIEIFKVVVDRYI